MVRLLYSSLLRLALPLWLARLWWRGAREPGYRQHLGERLGWGAPQAPGALWVHAVSLGETRAAAPLIEALRERLPGVPLLLTHGTATGREAGAALLQPGDRQVWLPIDMPGAVRRFLERQRPALGVLMETEVWPNLQAQAARSGVPMVLANARLSERSAAKGRRLGLLMRPALGAMRCVLAQTQTDAQRLRALGATDVRVMGNLKFDLIPREDLLALGRRWRQTLGRPVVLAAVTREGEEQALLQAWLAQRDAWRVSTAQTAVDANTAGQLDGAESRPPLLLIVPRHPQRFDEVGGLVTAAGLQLARRSAWTASELMTSDEPPISARAADVWLGDSLGEMALYYGLADAALLGGSFAPLGGQNLIEALACGCPIVVGPHTFNFAEAAAGAIEAGAAERVARLPDAVARLRQWLSPGRAEAHAQRQATGRAFAALHRGAAQRMAAAVWEVWTGRP
ncbi:MAG: 3-deoxy-D-manno-octulosonic acid transferase [Rubrivivax sp.]